MKNNILQLHNQSERTVEKIDCPFSIYTDIRKLQDKAKTSYTLSTRRLRFIKDFIYFPDNFAGGVAPPDKVKSEVDTT